MLFDDNMAKQIVGKLKREKHSKAMPKTNRTVQWEYFFQELSSTLHAEYIFVTAYDAPYQFLLIGYFSCWHVIF